jgi:hypothetical protein
MSVFSHARRQRIGAGMKWRVIRLELASNGEFPRGSAGRAYLLRLPLDDDGSIDAELLKAEPDRAVVRRYWANEADLIGHMIATSSGLAIRYEANERVDGRLFEFDADSIHAGEEVRLTDVDGRSRHFRVASLV